ncbi:hypothetical protein F5B22DRAFT_644676 [Xylaria bambusicola]|uniref:uncharacterized protein n=1 Tax=Xylaria bambusicola TaxID=326684 RepID=UPI0020083572|nr:uncharacterized protein F5B22DRAFT_644676 [Xylaria bambusicola]KAI0520936.1 hypothetical protein F5B22DRAFT_644676 [Xylaria bambusicola]
MKFRAVSALLAIGTTANAHVVPRSSEAIIGLLQRVFDSMSNADNHVLQYEGGFPSALRQAGEDLISVLSAGIDTAHNMEPLEARDVIAITPLSQKLSGVGAKFLKDIGEAAPKFAAGGYCSHVNTFVQHLSEVSDAFFEANKEKFPEESQGYAEKEIKATDGHFAEAKAALSPPVCIDAVKGGEGEGEPNKGGEGQGEPGKGGKGQGEPNKGGEGQGEPGKGGKGQGNEEPPKEKPSATTSAAWHTGAGHPGKPTGEPQGGCGKPADHGNGSGNSTNPQPHFGQPKPEPVKGAGHILLPSVVAAAMLAGVAFAL